VPAALLTAMGRDLGAIHAADRALPELRAHLSARPATWLHDAARVAAKAVEADYQSWV
jgi:hypothetical protein